MTNTVGEIPIDRIVIDQELQSRVRLDQSVFDDYLEAALQAEQDGQPWPFPPVKMVGGLLIDGHHRYEVAKRLGRPTILAIEEPGDEEDAVRAAVGANADHGLRRSQFDVRRAISLALKKFPDETDRAIARMAGTSHPTVAKVRRKINGFAGGNMENLSTRQTQGTGQTVLHHQGNAVVPKALGEQGEQASLDGQSARHSSSEVPPSPPCSSSRPGEAEAIDLNRIALIAHSTERRHIGPCVRAVDDMARILGGRGEQFERAGEALDELIWAVREMGKGVK